MIKIHRIQALATLFFCAAFSLPGCTPQFDWREVRGPAAPYRAAFPAKPATHARAINLDGLQITMTMTAADVNGVSFAIGSAPLPDASKAPAALQAMKLALLRNIGGTLRHDKPAVVKGSPLAAIDIEALGAPGNNTRGQPRLLAARFVAKDRYIYQALVVGPEKAVSREVLDTFFTSFTLD
jgi:hypothetical protein